MSVILKAENISKQYRLGKVGTGTLSDDFKRWWYGIRGKEDPFLKVGGVNNRSAKATEDYIWALRDINFEVEEGEVLGIIGKNGAGKSTLLKLLSRVTSPTTGSIKTKGRIASLLEIGTGFHPELTGRENIFMNGAVLGMTKTEIISKLDEIIAFSGCEMYIDTPVKRYSSGMKVRLGFAVAAHLEPEILVVDEVLAVGDADFQKKAIGKMQNLSKGEGRTVLFVSHNMASIKKLCSKSLVLENGEIGFIGHVLDGLEFYKCSRSKSVIFTPSLREGIKNSSIIKNVQFFNDKRQEISTILSGNVLNIEIKILSKEAENLEIGLGVYSSDDEPEFHCSTKTLRKKYYNQPKLFSANLIIPKWPLKHGDYYFNIYLRENGILVDYIKESIWIKSEKGDFYNTGVLPSWNKGFYCDFIWK
jgi:lipopolysaccharide transport system ATP-binding protein